eukprot:TRINITY_DN3302_c0_g1_i3.p1 TRINITY_DN3302_c0_g1~~TRINITY_DN3302_c0_g1_i3.p1  ORF type:complete len:191 (+),score=22.42 TRINITY_DN3302_c0_g1_i3:87-659(+)
MTGLLRRAARTGVAAPLRGGLQRPIRPVPAAFPLKSELEMGPHGWMRGSYYFWSLSNPIRGPMYRPPWVVGSTHIRTIDPEHHFNTQDRFLTCTWGEYFKWFMYNILPSRVFFIMLGCPVIWVLWVTWMEHRREPMEIFMDREEYFKDYDSYCFGVYFDHHHFAHMLCHRRSHKWGYAGQDITLEGDHHH